MKNYIAKKLLKHVGHDIAIMVYGDDENIYDVCVECLDCNEVLISAEDFDGDTIEWYDECYEEWVKEKLQDAGITFIRNSNPDLTINW